MKPYAIHRYEQQGDIIDALVDKMLEGKDYFLGDQYSIVDVAFYSWYFAAQRSGFDVSQHVNLVGWIDRVGQRPAVQRGVTIPAGLPPLPPRRRL